MEDYKNILNDNFLKKNPIIFKKYKPIKKIGCGSFGNIYSVIRLKDKSVFAMKKEKISQNNKSLESELYYSYTLQGGLGIPKLQYNEIKRPYHLIYYQFIFKDNIFLKLEYIKFQLF